MQPVIPAVPRTSLLRELNEKTFIREANNGDNQIYIINAHNAPETLKEIGRLREVTFRAAGGGTGKDCDLDEFDTNEKCYDQLIVWNPDDQEIVGGYRFIRCKKAKDAHGHFHLATTELFRFSEKFTNEYLPRTIELGRSFVQPSYQPSINNRKGLFSLDNLWDGLGALVVDNPDIDYFFGKVTTYRHFNVQARDYILHFMDHYFPDPEKLVTPIHPVRITTDISAFEKELGRLPYKEGHKLLNQHVRALGENIPPLVNSYMNLSATMRNFGCAVNSEFGDVDETGIMVTIGDIYPTKKERHIGTYHKKNP
ncbi:MAG TPA: GNAT family N-acetyltransferase [Bacteroidia bacterium]|nr:GNAT family N-acetyltransferase [Bacteroidia bacterium]